MKNKIEGGWAWLLGQGRYVDTLVVRQPICADQITPQRAYFTNLKLKIFLFTNAQKLRICDKETVPNHSLTFVGIKYLRECNVRIFQVCSMRFCMHHCPLCSFIAGANAVLQS
jgi:hypothetical protein